MADLIVFDIASRKYAFDIEHVKRIVSVGELTTLPNAHQLIDGIVPYDNSVVKVVNFRKMVGVKEHKEELIELFSYLKDAHGAWIDALKDALYNQTPFTKTIDPSACELGQWIEHFSSHDERIREVFDTLATRHQILHKRGGELLEMSDPKEALREYEEHLVAVYTQTMKALDEFLAKIDLIVQSMEKLIIYDSLHGEVFGIKVDAIADIVHVHEATYASEDVNKSSEFLEIEGVLQQGDTLINVIKTLKLPK